MRPRGLLFLVPFVILVSPASAVLAITTNAASGVGADSVTMNGDATGIVGSAVVWFEYSTISGKYAYKTDNQTLASDQAFTQLLIGVPFISNTVYYYRAVGYDGALATGAEQTFTTSALAAVSDYNFESNFAELEDSQLELTNTSKVAVKPYTDVMGTIFWGILYALIFAIIWIRQQDITIPALLGLLIGAFLWGAMPEDWRAVGMSLTVISFAGIMFTLIRGRQT